MAFRSAAVVVREFDFTAYAAALGLATLAVIGGASKGALNKPRLFTSEPELIAYHGAPLDNDSALHAALAFLRKGNKLIFTRIANGATTADYPLAGLTGAVPAVKATATIAFSSSINPADGDTVTVTGGRATLTLENDAVGALGNVAVTQTRSALVITGMSGGSASAKATGKLVFVTQPADGNTVTISDGTTSRTFEFDSNASVGGGNTSVTIGADVYATAAALETAIDAYAFNVSATDATVKTVFEFDSNAAYTSGRIGVTIGTTSAATLLNLITALSNNASAIGAVPSDSTTTVPQLTLTRTTGGVNGNAPLLKSGTNIVITGFSGGVDAVTGTAATVGGLYAASPGSWGNDLVAKIQATTTIGAPSGNFDLLVFAPVDDSGTLLQVERFNNLSIDSTSDRFIEDALASGIRGEVAASNYLRADIFAGTSAVGAGTITLGISPGNAGSDGVSSLTAADYIGTVSGNTSTGLKALSNPESVQFNILAVPGKSHKDILNAALALVEKRGDAIFIIDPPFGLTRDQVIDWHNGTSTVVANAPTVPFNSSYAAVYWPWCQRYDQYLKKDIWQPPSGFVAAAYAYTDKVAGPWYAPAGHNRGPIDAEDIETSPDETDRDLLNAGSNVINPIVRFPDGIKIYGNRTTQRRATDLDSVHVRRLLLYAEALVANSVKFLLFDPNNELTWRNFVLMVNPILENIKANQRVEDFRVVCDATTNPPNLRQQKTMNGKILIKAIGAAEIIEVDFALFASGAEFTTNF